MKLICAKHKRILTELFCQDCYRDRVRALEIEFKGQNVTVSISGVPDKINSTNGHTGLLPKHEMTYLESYLPASVYADACNFIDKRMEAFTKVCPCAACLFRRNTLDTPECTPPT